MHAAHTAAPHSHNNKNSEPIAVEYQKSCTDDVLSSENHTLDLASSKKKKKKMIRVQCAHNCCLCYHRHPCHCHNAHSSKFACVWTHIIHRLKNEHKKRSTHTHTKYRLNAWKNGFESFGISKSERKTEKLIPNPNHNIPRKKARVRSSERQKIMHNFMCVSKRKRGKWHVL